MQCVSEKETKSLMQWNNVNIIVEEKEVEMLIEQAISILTRKTIGGLTWTQDEIDSVNVVEYIGTSKKVYHAQLGTLYDKILTQEFKCLVFYTLQICEGVEPDAYSRIVLLRSVEYAVVGRGECHLVGQRDGSHCYVVNEYAEERTLQSAR